MNQFGPSSFKVIPDVVKNLLIINGLFFLATFALKNTVNLEGILGLHYFDSDKFHPYQLITHMFMHGGMMHIFSNMFSLWMFGSTIENFWGGKKFLIYYLITGFGAAVVHYVVVHFQIQPTLDLIDQYLANPNLGNLDNLVGQHRFHINKYSDLDLQIAFSNFQSTIGSLNAFPNNTIALGDATAFLNQYREFYLGLPNIVGASGAVFGILLAFGMLFPNLELMFIFIPVPIKAKYLVLGYGAFELYRGIQNSMGDNIAHFAHLGGMLFGFILIKYWGKNRHNQNFS